MDEFSKTKIGFTVALLATVFALKPLIDAYGNVGFTFFDINITAKLAFFATLGFLGIAVYFISLQFVSSKQIYLFDKISDVAYALSLSVPVLFCVLWLLVLIGEGLARVATSVPEIAWNIIAGVVAGLLTNLLTKTISSALKKKGSELREEDSRKKELEILSRAERLIDDGHYDLSILESGKIIELALRQAVTFSTGEAKMYSLHNLIQRAHKLNLVSESDLEQINSVRILRNNANHLDSKVTKEDASKAVAVAKRLIKTLSFAKNIAGYNWLKVNRPEALKALEGSNDNLLNTVISHLWDAWKNRDGAISGELSEFFETLLKNNPQPLVDLFKKDQSQFDSWLDQIDTQMFTDYIGGQSANLENLKLEILENLKKYTNSIDNEKDRDIAHRIMEKLNTISVREIE